MLPNEFIISIIEQIKFDNGDFLSSQLTHFGSIFILIFLAFLIFFVSDIFQKFAAVNETQREWLVECKVHEGLMLLLRGHGDDLIALHCALHALLALAHW